MTAHRKRKEPDSESVIGCRNAAGTIFVDDGQVVRDRRRKSVVQIWTMKFKVLHGRETIAAAKEKSA